MGEKVIICEGWLGRFKASLVSRGENKIKAELFDKVAGSNQVKIRQEPVLGVLTCNQPIKVRGCRRRCRLFSTSSWIRRKRLCERKQGNYLAGSLKTLSQYASIVARKGTHKQINCKGQIKPYLQQFNLKTLLAVVGLAGSPNSVGCNQLEVSTHFSHKATNTLLSAIEKNIDSQAKTRHVLSTSN